MTLHKTYPTLWVYGPKLLLLSIHTWMDCLPSIALGVIHTLSFLLTSCFLNLIESNPWSMGLLKWDDLFPVCNKHRKPKISLRWCLRHHLVQQFP